MVKICVYDEAGNAFVQVVPHHCIPYMITVFTKFGIQYDVLPIDVEVD